MRIFVATGVMLVFTAVVACSGAEAPGDAGSTPVPDRPIDVVLREHTDGLMALPGVVGTAQGECAGQPCIRVLVVQQTDELSAQIPSDIEGYPVAIDVTGEIKALDE